MIKATSVDDDLPALQLIEKYCSKIDAISLDATFYKSVDALDYIRSNEVDLLFLDINMPSLNGIDLYKALSKKVMVVFTTASSKHAVTAFELNAVDYLLKPFSFDRFLQAVNKAYDIYKFQFTANKGEDSSIVIRADYSFIKIKLSEILYLESQGDYIKIHLLNQRPILTLMKMKDAINLFPNKQFIRIHRSYIVSLQHIEKVRNKTVFIYGIALPLSKNYEEEFYSCFTTKSLFL